MADDAAKVAPDAYKVIFENERTRVLEVGLKPGQSTAMHSHPGYVVYMLGAGKVRFTSPSGETAELELPAGTAMWRDAEEHATENIGATEVRGLFFEPK
jgi:quercetin dioxygenase-like cupin family protein